MITISVMGFKGGVCKTSTATALCALLPHSLAIDLDMQCDLSNIVGADISSEANIYSVLQNNINIKFAIQKNKTSDIVPASEDLEWLTNLEPETLRKALKSISKSYQYVVLDTPPGFSPVNLAALVASDYIVAPVTLDGLGVNGVMNLAKKVAFVRDNFTPHLSIAGILLTRTNMRHRLKRNMLEVISDIAENLGTRLFRSHIRESVTIGESQSYKMPVFSYKPDSDVAKDYISFVKELEEIINGKTK